MLEIGQETPILVRRDRDRFVLVEGLHRLEACKALGEETIVLELAARHKIPAIYPHRYFAVGGGLMSYDADATVLWRLVGSLYVAQILKGAKPADLPIQQPTKFEFVINVQTARTLGIKVPAMLLAITDEAIE
jgi:putative ABC transport system substrate-binding protein